MKTTIGEVVNFITPYCGIVEVRTAGEYPFVHGKLVNACNFNVGHIYVLQTAPGVYNITHTDDDLHGNRYFPLSFFSDSMVQEKDFSNIKFNENSILEKRELEEIPSDQLIFYLTGLFLYYGVVKVSVNKLNTRIADLGFRSKSIQRTFEQIFQRNHKSGTILDFLNLFFLEDQTIRFSNLKEREIMFIIQRFHDFGILLKIKYKELSDISFQKCS